MKVTSMKQEDGFSVTELRQLAKRKKIAANWTLSTVEELCVICAHSDGHPRWPCCGLSETF